MKVKNFSAVEPGCVFTRIYISLYQLALFPIIILQVDRSLIRLLKSLPWNYFLLTSELFEMSSCLFTS